jgi:hypothetical protein
LFIDPLRVSPHVLPHPGAFKSIWFDCLLIGCESDELKYNEHWIAIKALVAGVRKHGTYKRHMRAPHREVLAVRGLAQRGKLRTDHPALAFLAKQGDNGAVWHILSYWRPDN